MWDYFSGLMGVLKNKRKSCADEYNKPDQGAENREFSVVKF
jgi:hypothetical protein